MKLDIYTQNLMMSNKEFETEKNYWLHYLRGEIIMGVFPADYPDLRSSEARKENITSVFPDDLFSRITTISNHSEYGTYIILLSGIFFLLYKYTGYKDITIGIPAFTPNDGEYLEQILGLRGQIKNTETFKDSLLALKEMVNQVRQYQNFPLEAVARSINLMPSDPTLPLFPTVILMENLQDQKCLDGVRTDTLISFRLSDRNLTLKLEYNANLYQKESLNRLINHLFNYYYTVTANPGVELAEIGILTEAERQCIMSQFNDTKLEYTRLKTIHQLFEEQVEQNPGNIALEIGESRLTYDELNRRANQVARKLRMNNIKADSIVGILAERSLELIIGIIAILKAGGAYLPIDPEYPGDRIQYMLENSNAEILLTQSHLAGKIVFFDKIMVFNDERLYTGDDSNLEQRNALKDLVYVIYTSGSTGKPKGVMIEHHSLVNFLFCMYDKFKKKVEAGDNCLSLTNIAFDVSVAEIFLPLVFGAKLVLYETKQIFDVRELSRIIAAKSITFAYIPPILLQDVFQCLKSMNAEISLNKMLVGVESIKDYVLEDYLKLNNSMIIINGYGPTESTICATFYRYQSKNPEGKNVPIGRPLANTKVYIIDETSQPVPAGIAGELWISGDGLARGYINNPELTKEKFRSNPLLNGERIYATGDLARWLPDGNIEFLGRKDLQVKIRGYRIELGEIETHLINHPLVREAIVLAREEQGARSKTLCAYVVAENIKTAELREYLALHLPEYMIPSFFIFLDQIPLTPNGKVDRKSLPDPKTAVDNETAYVPPQTGAGWTMARIWQEVLGIARVGMNDNFFHLGGDSIKALKAATLAEENQIHISVADLLKYRTIGEILESVDYLQAKQGPISQAEVSGPVLLTPTQHWFFEQQFTHSHYWNQANLFTLREDIQLERLTEALRKIIEHHDALRIGFRWKDQAVIQFNRSMAEVDFQLRTIDLSADDPQIQAQKLREISEAIQDKLDPAHELLLQACVFNLGAAGRRLWIAVHHLIIDAVSWRIILEDLTRLLESEPMAILPPKTTSFQTWSRELHDYAAVGPFDLEYWQGIDRSRLTQPDVAWNAAGCRGEYQDITLALTPELTRNLLTVVHRAYDTEMNDILLAALVMALNETTAMESILLNLEGFGREEIIPGVDLSRTVGWFTTVTPVFLEAKPSIAETIINLKDNLDRIPKRGIFYGICRYLSGQNQSLSDLNPVISFNYLGQLDMSGTSPNPALSPAPEQPGRTIHPQNRHPYLLDINCWVADGQFRVMMSRHPGYLKSLPVQQPVNSFIHNLEMIINHCLAGVKQAASSNAAFSTGETSGRSVRELPVNLQNEITSYLCHSLPLCVILADQRFYPWFYEHFIQIYAYGDEDDYMMFEFLEMRAPYKEIIQEVYLGYELLEEVAHIVDFVTRKIDLGYYVIIHVDEYYLPEKQTYRKQHYVHHSLIYGYDQQRGKLKAIGFDANHLFTYLTFDYRQFTEAYENGKQYYQEAAPWAKTNAVELLRPRPYQGDYPFDIKKFVQKFNDYLAAKGDPAVIYTFERDPRKVRFGMAVYDVIEANFELLRQGVVKIDYRVLHGLAEHKRGLLSRFKFIISRYKCHDELAHLTAEFEQVVALVESARKIYFEQTFTGALQGFYNPLPEITAMDKMTDILRAARDKEQRVLEQIKGQLEMVIE